MIECNQSAGQSKFSNDIAALVAHSDVQVIAAYSPRDEDVSSDLQCEVAADSIHNPILLS